MCFIRGRNHVKDKNQRCEREGEGEREREREGKGEVGKEGERVVCVCAGGVKP